MFRSVYVVSTKFESNSRHSSKTLTKKRPHFLKSTENRIVQSRLEFRYSINFHWKISKQKLLLDESAYCLLVFFSSLSWWKKIFVHIFLGLSVRLFSMSPFTGAYWIGPYNSRMMTKRVYGFLNKNTVSNRIQKEKFHHPKCHKGIENSSVELIKSWDIPCMNKIAWPQSKGMPRDQERRETEEKNEKLKKKSEKKRKT